MKNFKPSLDPLKVIAVSLLDTLVRPLAIDERRTKTKLSG